MPSAAACIGHRAMTSNSDEHNEVSSGFVQARAVRRDKKIVGTHIVNIEQ